MNRDGIRKEGIHALDFASKRSREMFNLEQVIKQKYEVHISKKLKGMKTNNSKTNKETNKNNFLN